MVKVWRCQICGDPYIGETAPDNCPFCGAHKKFIVDIDEAKVNFNVELSDKDSENVEHALQVEVSNAAFYFCAAEKTNDQNDALMFKALGKVEAEHASIWRKILKLDETPNGDDECYVDNKENLQESHDRETRAIEFYKQAAAEADDERIKEIFEALVDVEEDHLALSGVRLK